MRPALPRVLTASAVLLVPLLALPLPAHSADRPRWDPTPVQRLVDEAAQDGVRLSVGVQSLDGATLTDGPVVVGSREPYSSASLIKLALVATVLRQADRGVLALDQPMTVHSGDLVPGSGVLGGYGMPYDTTLAELARLTITVSDNSAANLLAETVGLDEVDDLAADLGLGTTHMGRLFFSSGPDGESNVLDTDDTVDLLRAVNDELLEPHSRTLLLGWMRAQEVDTKFAVALDGVALAHKTGDTSRVSHDAGYLLEPGRHTVLVVLSEYDGPGSAQAVADPYVERAAELVHEQVMAAPRAPAARRVAVQPVPTTTPTPTTAVTRHPLGAR